MPVYNSGSRPLCFDIPLPSDLPKCQPAAISLRCRGGEGRFRDERWHSCPPDWIPTRQRAPRRRSCHPSTRSNSHSCPASLAFAAASFPRHTTDTHLSPPRVCCTSLLSIPDDRNQLSRPSSSVGPRLEIFLHGAIKLLLLLAGLEATVSPFAGRVNELQVDLLQCFPARLRHQ